MTSGSATRTRLLEYRTGDMLIQTTLPNSIEAALSFVSDDRKQDLLCDWIPSDENWQKGPRSNWRSWDDCREPISSIREEKDSDAGSQFLIQSNTYSTVSATRNMCASSAPNLVYKRRKLQSNSIDFYSAQTKKLTKESNGYFMSVQDDHFSSEMQNETDSARDIAMGEMAHSADLGNENTSASGPSYPHKFDKVPSTKTEKTRDMQILSKLESSFGCSGGEGHRFVIAPNVMVGVAHNADLSNKCTSTSGPTYSHKFNEVPSTEMENTRDIKTLSKLESTTGCSGGEEHGFDITPNVARVGHNEDLANENTSTSRPTYPHKFDEVPSIRTEMTRDMETVLKLGSVNGCSGGEEQGFDIAPSAEPVLQYNTISSSTSNMELGSPKADIDDFGECSSSFNSQCLSEKELCISILRSHGLLDRFLPSGNCTSIDLAGIHGITNCNKSCKTCGHSESPLKMLICDNCDGAFHVSCCNPRMKKIPIGEWYCQPCSRKKHKCSRESAPKSVDAKGETSNCKNATSKSAIVLMLNDTEPYTTGVRIGKAFQADIPEWSGPITEEFDCFGQPLEMSTEHPSSNGWNMKRSFTPKSVGNWLQCREEDSDGKICGKWRRAPLFEVQTDRWDCSCAVVWDPIHSDCAVPQELETHQVLAHLKYVELLRPRLLGKKRKPSPSRSEAEDIRSVPSKHGVIS